MRWADELFVQLSCRESKVITVPCFSPLNVLSRLSADLIVFLPIISFALISNLCGLPTIPSVETSISRRFFCRLCNEFEEIARKALTTPANTQQLMELKAFMEKVESETMYSLEKKLIQAKNRLAFLVDFAQFSPTDIRSNTKTFTWNGRMPGIIDEHRAIIAEKKAQYEDALKVRVLCLTRIHVEADDGVVLNKMGCYPDVPSHGCGGQGS
jgi:hypothetical protein